MSATNTSISWTDATWNPLRGCSRVSTGCEHCYAEQQAGRFSGSGQAYEGLVRKTSHGFKWTGDVRLIEKDLDTPLLWKKPRRIFVNSMSDLFHESVPAQWIDSIFGMMWSAQWHTFQILTKRPERMCAYLTTQGAAQAIAYAAYTHFQRLEPAKAAIVPIEDFLYDIQLPLPNVWLGVSVENQATADARIPWLLRAPAAIRFVSYEPALEAVNFEHIGNALFDREAARREAMHGPAAYNWDQTNAVIGHPELDWLICGGESGPHARPCNLAWLRSVVRQCLAAGVACYVKQLGSHSVGGCGALMNADSPVLWDSRFHWHHKAGADPTEWPEDLRVQQFPEVRP